MRRWSELAERVASTTRTSEKTGLLADYLRTLTEEELPLAVVFLTGRPFPEADQRATGIGWATIANALGQVAGTDRGELAAAYDRFSDISAAVGDVLARSQRRSPRSRRPPDRLARRISSRPCWRAPIRRRPAASSGSCRASFASGSARASSRRPSQRRSIVRSMP
jgi:hypothetical protein